MVDNQLHKTDLVDVVVVIDENCVVVSNLVDVQVALMNIKWWMMETRLWRKLLNIQMKKTI